PEPVVVLAPLSGQSAVAAPDLGGPHLAFPGESQGRVARIVAEEVKLLVRQLSHVLGQGSVAIPKRAEGKGADGSPQRLEMATVDSGINFLEQFDPLAAWREIGLDLAVPRFAVEAQEPLGQFCPLLVGEVG